MKKEHREIKTLRGTMTIEFTYLLPIIFLVFLLVIYTVFYYHDKNILIGAAGETAILGAQIERKPDETGQTDLKKFYRERIAGKLVLFAETDVEIKKTQKYIEVTLTAKKGGMKIRVAQRASLTEPEKFIRRKRLLQKNIR